MLHAKLQNHRSSGFWRRRFLKVFAFYSHGAHLGHATWTMYTNFRSPFLRMLHMKFGFEVWLWFWPAVQNPSQFDGFDVGSSLCVMQKCGKTASVASQNPRNPPHQKTNNLNMRKQRRRSAVQLLHTASLLSLHRKKACIKT